MEKLKEYLNIVKMWWNVCKTELIIGFIAGTFVAIAHPAIAVVTVFVAITYLMWRK